MSLLVQPMKGLVYIDLKTFYVFILLSHSEPNSPFTSDKRNIDNRQHPIIGILSL
jgi:hypothetical protein